MVPGLNLCPLLHSARTLIYDSGANGAWNEKEAFQQKFTFLHLPQTLIGLDRGATVQSELQYFSPS